MSGERFQSESRPSTPGVPSRQRSATAMLGVLRWGGLEARVRARGRRVLWLVLLICLLSLGDLLVTWTFLTSMGMEEMNPLARFVIRMESPPVLVLFKIGSVAACVSLILLIRHRVQGEAAAWLAAMILVALTVRWHFYTHEMLDFNDTVTIMEAQSSDAWLIFTRRLADLP